MAWYLAGSLTLFQDGFLDPYFYTGYVNHYSAMLERFGLTYYATRIADIFPQRALGTVFGFEGGYYAWHYLLAVAALGSVYAVARRHQGVQTAVIVTAFLAVCPWLPRALMWDYVDGAAISFVLVGIYFLLGSRARMPIRWVAAGVFFSLAVNCNIFVLVVVGAFLFAWTCYGFRARSVRRRVIALAWVGGGMLALQLALATFMAVAYPTAGFFFMFKNSHQGSTLFNGDPNSGYRSIGDALKVSPWIMVPIVAGLVTVAFALTTRRSVLPPDRRALVRLVALFFAALGLVYVVLQLAQQPTTYLFYYVDYFIPAVALGAMVVVGELLRLVSPRMRGDATGGTVVALLIAYVVQRDGTVADVDLRVPLLVLGAGTLLVVVVRRVDRAVALVVLLLTLAATPLAFLVETNNDYSPVARGQNQSVEWDVYREAHSFQDAVFRAVPANRRVGFWYGSAPGLSSIQSMFLYNYTKVFDDSDAMPAVTPTLLANIGQFDYLVLLGVSSRAVDDGTRALCSAGQSLRQVGRHVVRGDVQDLAFVIFRRTASGGCTGSGAA